MPFSGYGIARANLSMTSMKNVGRRLGLTIITCLLSTTALAQSAVASAPTHDPWALGIPALTAVFTATLTLGGGALFARRKDKSSARHLAMRIAVLLEGYAITCAESLSDWELHSSSGGHAGTMMNGIPDIPDYPDEDGWSALKPKLLDRALTLRNQVRIGRRSVASYAEFEIDPDDIANHEAGHLGVCGHKAWELARDLRTAYRVEPFDLTTTFWDIAPFLQRNHDRIIEERIAAQTDAIEGKRKVDRAVVKVSSR